MAAFGKAQTIKQAKATFKARGRPSVSEREKKQIERAAELEQRAERIREFERRKATLAKRKAEKEKKEKEEKEQQRLGSQRRCDRFGRKSSQFHLRAFLQPVQELRIDDGPSTAEEDKFHDDGVDDEMLLNALCQPTALPRKTYQPAEYSGSTASLMLPPPPPPPPRNAVFPQVSFESCPRGDDFDVSNFWDQIASSTQIAKELEHEETGTHGNSPSSFGSGSLDLTADDFERLDRSPPAISALEQQKLISASVSRTRSLVRNSAMQASPIGGVESVKPKVAINSCSRSSSSAIPQDFGYTLSQLEGLVDNEIQLTQASCG